MDKRIYLAAPYTDYMPEIRQHRYDAVSKMTAELMKEGYIIFSPITHSHYLSEYYGCPNEPEFWQRWYLTFLEHWATDLYVLKLYGWNKSRGVIKEIKYARQKGLSITYIDLRHEI